LPLQLVPFAWRIECDDIVDAAALVERFGDTAHPTKTDAASQRRAVTARPLT
jgi:hypothetical protein